LGQGGGRQTDRETERESEAERDGERDRREEAGVRRRNDSTNLSQKNYQSNQIEKYTNKLNTMPNIHTDIQTQSAYIAQHTHKSRFTHKPQPEHEKNARKNNKGENEK
jgi:hypothetical protein